jgi:hypothetical protein
LKVVLAFESFWGALKVDVVALAAALDDADEDEACGWFVLIGLVSSGLAFHITLFPLLDVSLAVFSSVAANFWASSYVVQRCPSRA